MLIRDQSAVGHDLALVTTDLTATLAHVIERYASRWSIEIGHRWYRSSCAAFSWLRSLLIVGFLSGRGPEGNRTAGPGGRRAGRPALWSGARRPQGS